MRTPFLLGLALAAAPLQGQTADTAAGPILSLEEAQALARRNNPEHLQTTNDRRAAGAAVRSAYGNLLPRVDASFTGQYQEGGDQFFNGVRLSTSSDVVQSQYQLGLTYNLNAATLIQPRLQRANADAVEADITGSAAALRSSVAQQYLNVLQAQARAALADTLVRAAETQVALARARAAVGAATQLDVRRAEVEHGQQQVVLIRARNDVEIEKLRLFQRMGVPQPADVRLTTTFAVTPPTFTLDSVLDLARGRNPVLLALRSREKVAGLNVRSQQSAYTPTLRLSTGWGGYSQGYWDDDAAVNGVRAARLQSREQCFSQDSVRVGAGLTSIAGSCAAIDFTGSDAAAVRSANDRYPLDFTRAPWAFSATVSLPLFDGFTREQRVQEATAQRDDARQSVRARELALTADVTAAYLTLTAAQQAVAQQELNAQKAREELMLAEERYRVGAVTFLDVVQSRSAFERVEADRITAVYDYHKAFAALESAVGRPLR
ncbi:MAG TPA: TolC family protein [Gemmatimonadaceae bacterium]|nr:TolC family protein [Gemmatimonadaceae bacterium]